MIAEQAIQQSTCTLTDSSRAMLSARALTIAFALSSILLGAFVLLWPTTAAFINQWTSDHNETYTHGSLITAISFWLIVRNRQKYALVPATWSLVGLIFLLSATFVWLVAVRSGILTVHEVLFPLVAWLGVYAALGRRMAFACAFPFAFLLFQTIAWDFVSPVLQRITVLATDFLLSATSIPAYVEGNLIHLPIGTFEVAGGCSGLHFFIVALALGALYGELEDASIKNRAVLIVMATVTAMVTNWLRVYGIVLAGYLTDMQHYLVTVEHYWFGWGIFAVTMIGFFYCARRFTTQGAEERSQYPVDHRQPHFSLWVAVSGSIAVFATASLWNLLTPIRVATAASVQFPSRVAGWSGPEVVLASSRPVFENADRIDSGAFLNGTAHVDAHVVTYLSQTQGRELTSYKNSPLSPTAVRNSSGEPVDVWPAKELIEENASGLRTVLQYGYVVGRRHTSSGLVAQVSYGLRSLIGPVPSHAIVVRSPCNESSCTEARQVLRSFVMSSGLAGR
jgi:exosortase A